MSEVKIWLQENETNSHFRRQSDFRPFVDRIK